ncbi:NAD(P)-binding protein-27 [Coleophoma crateriformis]|uniref:NAD(P)-binding protein-27 n=1 Tax=Coleophoma crateriformis TaxID=565419 RepID=A0A3D8QID7_9HELO|nr:NAD(P)-binding protein-27 [Coleophoma crateriformis]
MAPVQRTALITGGASGMGLAVAQALSARGNWSIYLVDLNSAAGNAAAASLKNACFHQCNITSYASLSAVFQRVFRANSRIDFVFANAGIAEKANFYTKHAPRSDDEVDDDNDEPPPEPDLLVVDICLKAVITTSYLALHYFRKSPKDAQSDRSLVMTASCGGLYPSHYSPIYSAAKHGVVGFMRSIAKHFWVQERIRVNAICPGTVKTNLLTAKEWKNFPEEFFTPVEMIVQTVLRLIDGEDEEQGKRRIDGPGRGDGTILWGEAVEVSGRNHYYREAARFCDEGMMAVMRATDVEELEH